uniref:Uncharacterized protein n=1 Tax=Arundo donax TaxID=35708 RepID=A0A0A9AT93_ARUDO
MARRRDEARRMVCAGRRRGVAGSELELRRKADGELTEAGRRRCDGAGRRATARWMVSSGCERTR